MLRSIIYFTLLLGVASCTCHSIDQRVLIAKTLYSLGAIKISEGDEEFARALFSEALKYELGQLEATYGLGYCCAKNCSNDAGDCDTALKLLDEVIKYRPLYRKAYYNRGVVNEYKGNYRQAIRDYSCAIFIDNKDADYYYARGNTWRKLGYLQLALNDYQEAACMGDSRANKQIKKIQQEKEAKCNQVISPSN